MGLVYSRTDGGLVVVEHSADEAAVRAALKRHDPELELFREIDRDYMTWVWKVNRRAPDGSFEFVLGWRQGGVGEPLPLSMRLVDEVQRHDRNCRGDLPPLAELEERKRREDRKDYLREAEAIVKEFGPRLDEKRFTPMPRSQSLRLARDKQRARMARNPELRP